MERGVIFQFEDNKCMINVKKKKKEKPSMCIQSIWERMLHVKV